MSQTVCSKCEAYLSYADIRLGIGLCPKHQKEYDEKEFPRILQQILVHRDAYPYIGDLPLVGEKVIHKRIQNFVDKKK